tara:strand:- start:165 stop:530 length:366 start_codon:yes stop_codon:yes gene_type:complete
MIEYIVEKLLPKELINSNQDKEEILFKVTTYVKNSIDTSGFFVKFPEKSLRVVTYIFFKFFMLIEIISLKKIKFKDCLNRFLKMSSFFGDGIRLYKSLAFFALFEDIELIEKNISNEKNRN